jgi:hypothetical protein
MSESFLKSDKLNRVKSQVKEWSLYTKFDCYSKIFQTKNVILKLVWLIFFLIFTALTGYFVSKNVIDYYSREVISKIEIINEKPIEFPVITLCNANPFMSQKAQEIFSNISLSTYGVNYMDKLRGDEEFSNLLEMTKMYVNSKDFVDKRKELKNGLKIMKCIFNNVKCNIEQDFSRYFSYQYGNCLQFNKNLTHTKETITEGPAFGLLLDIHLNSTPFNYDAFHLNGVGLKLFIHNKTFDNRITEEISLRLGQETNVALKRTFTSKTPYPYSVCEDLESTNMEESEYVKILKYNNKTYRQYDCFKLCLQEMVNEKCQCHYTKFLPVNTHLRPCLNLSQLECIYNEQNAFRDEKLNECNRKCPLECEWITYETQMSSLDLISSNATGVNVSKESLLSLKVYYSFTQFTEIREFPKTLLFDLVSQIGGSMGMLLGFSIFHLIELVEIIILVNLSFFRN